MRIFKLSLALLVLNCFCLTGCQQHDSVEEAIARKQQAYENWLKQQRPFMANLPQAAIIKYEFTTFDSDGKISPSVICDLKAGQWDGVVELWFILKLDPNGQPIGFSDESVTFFRLPAKESVITQDGKKRNVYYGVKLTQAEDVADIIKRISTSGDFSNYPKQTEESSVTVCGFIDSNDPWKNHRTK
jgi:hypothetical protein